MRRTQTTRDTGSGSSDTSPLAHANQHSTIQHSKQMNSDRRNPHASSLGTTSMVPTQRNRRTLFRKSSDPHHSSHYGTPVSKPKDLSSLRILFQNIKGLSHYSTGEDQEYYLTHLRDLKIDIAGLSETNTAWQHQSYVTGHWKWGG
jgi:hypothetical protein